MFQSATQAMDHIRTIVSLQKESHFIELDETAFTEDIKKERFIHFSHSLDDLENKYAVCIWSLSGRPLPIPSFISCKRRISSMEGH
jgi:hypothetical protein